jgi:hypothetical protein
MDIRRFEKSGDAEWTLVECLTANEMKRGNEKVRV